MPGVQLQLSMGPTIAEPVPAEVAEALVSAEVTHQEEGRSGFQLLFHVGRAGSTDLADYNFLRNPLFKPFNRVILELTLGGSPRVLFDGVITHLQFNPSAQPGGSTLSLTGEDVSVMMDLHEYPNFYPASHDGAIALTILNRYLRYGLIPLVTPPPWFSLPPGTEQTPCKVGTDLAILKALAQKHGYVFYLAPGPVKHSSYAWWGPLLRDPRPQRPLSFNLGAETNVDTLSFGYNALEPTLMAGFVHDSQLNATLPVTTFRSTRRQLSERPALTHQFPRVRTRMLQETQGTDALEAWWDAQARTDASVDKVVTGSGELNALRYGDVLQARALVPVRGAGHAYDGLYYVRSVTHSISRGEWKQKFFLTREGLGTTIQSVNL